MIIVICILLTISLLLLFLSSRSKSSNLIQSHNKSLINRMKSESSSHSTLTQIEEKYHLEENNKSNTVSNRTSRILFYEKHKKNNLKRRYTRQVNDKILLLPFGVVPDSISKIFSLRENTEFTLVNSIDEYISHLLYSPDFFHTDGIGEDLSQLKMSSISKHTIPLIFIDCQSIFNLRGNSLIKDLKDFVDCFKIELTDSDLPNSLLFVFTTTDGLTEESLISKLKRLFNTQSSVIDKEYDLLTNLIFTILHENQTHFLIYPNNPSTSKQEDFIKVLNSINPLMDPLKLFKYREHKTIIENTLHNISDLIIDLVSNSKFDKILTQIELLSKLSEHIDIVIPYLNKVLFTIAMEMKKIESSIHQIMNRIINNIEITSLEGISLQICTLELFSVPYLGTEISECYNRVINTITSKCTLLKANINEIIKDEMWKSNNIQRKTVEASLSLLQSLVEIHPTIKNTTIQYYEEIVNSIFYQLTNVAIAVEKILQTETPKYHDISRFRGQLVSCQWVDKHIQKNSKNSEEILKEIDQSILFFIKLIQIKTKFQYSRNNYIEVEKLLEIVNEFSSTLSIFPYNTNDIITILSEIDLFFKNVINDNIDGIDKLIKKCNTISILLPDKEIENEKRLNPEIKNIFLEGNKILNSLQSLSGISKLVGESQNIETTKNSLLKSVEINVIQKIVDLTYFYEIKFELCYQILDQMKILKDFNCLSTLHSTYDDVLKVVNGLIVHRKNDILLEIESNNFQKARNILDTFKQSRFLVRHCPDAMDTTNIEQKLSKAKKIVKSVVQDLLGKREYITIRQILDGFKGSKDNELILSVISDYLTSLFEDTCTCIIFFELSEQDHVSLLAKLNQFLFWKKHILEEKLIFDFDSHWKILNINLDKKLIQLQNLKSIQNSEDKLQILNNLYNYFKSIDIELSSDDKIEYCFDKESNVSIDQWKKK